MNTVFEFATQKNFTGALAFYFTFLLGSLLVLFVVGVAVGVYLTDEQLEAFGNISFMLGNIVAVIEVTVLSVLIVRAKKMTQNTTAILLGVGSFILAILGGLLLGLLPLAYLLTRPSENSREEVTVL